MTNAEAIETLRANYPDACFEQLRCAVDMAIKALEEPQRKKGKWIEHNPHRWGLGIVFECSECGEKIDREPSNFCPNCGAEMREPEDIPMEYFESGGR